MNESQNQPRDTTATWHEGAQHAQSALVLGILGLFVLGLIFGPMATRQASKAERLGHPAGAGRTLGTVATVFGAVWVMGFIVFAVARG